MADLAQKIEPLALINFKFKNGKKKTVKQKIFKILSKIVLIFYFKDSLKFKIPIIKIFLILTDLILNKRYNKMSLD